jgi:hypothetical protein
MRRFEPCQNVYHQATGIPARVVRVVGDIVTVEMAGKGRKTYPADEIETIEERNARLEVESQKNHPTRKPPNKPLHDV